MKTLVFTLISLFGIVQMAFSQIDISGTVTDEDGQPLPGVNITVEGKEATGTQTDFDGNYSLTAEKEAILQFSYVGFKSRNIEVGESDDIDVTLEESQESLGEVELSVGFGEQKEEDLTGSVQNVDLDAVENVPNTNVFQSLEGSVPGLSATPSTTSGGTPDIEIRGTNTISGSKDVLVVLDEVPYEGSPANLNPDDIESIDVLKGISAKAVYGSKAANGVILIETKKGKEGKPRVNVNSKFAWQKPTKSLRPMKREEYINHIKDIYWDEAYLEPDYTELNPDFDVAKKVEDRAQKDDNGELSDNNYDWWKEGTQTSIIREVNANISGGSDKVNYLFSLGHTREEGYMKNDNFQRENVRINLSTDPFEWLEMGMNVSGSFIKEDGMEPDMEDLLKSSPLIKPRDEDGNLKTHPFNSLDENPFLTSEVNDKDRTNDFFGKFFTEIDIPFIEGLKYKLNFGNNYRAHRHYYASEFGAGETGEAYKHYSNDYDYTVDNILTYSRDFGKHNMDATLLYGAYERKMDSTAANASNFDRLDLIYNRLQDSDLQFARSSAFQESNEYQMLRINYGFDERYLFTGTIRRDGFSGFSENNKYGTFPSIAGGWTISNESFFESNFFNFLKMRIEYGVTGNQTSRYKSLNSLLTRASYVFGDNKSFGQGLDKLGNNDLKWEETTGINFGIDFGLIQNRVNGSLEFYHESTKNLLFDVSIPMMNGVEEVPSNLGKIKNTGFEFTINSTNIETEDFKWQSRVNFSTNKNKIKKLLGKNEEGEEEDLTSSRLFIGESLGAIYDYEVNGKYQVSDDIPSGYGEGSFKIVDQNDDGKINSDDRKILGKEEPAYRFSIWNKFEYKNFSLSFLINSIQGGSNGYLGNDQFPLYGSADNQVRHNYYSGTDFWSPSNPNGKNPRTQLAPSVEGVEYHSRSFLRLQDLSLNYTFKESMFENTPIEDLSLFFSGKNLITWTNWKGWDPETSDGGRTYMSRPNLKTYSVGLNLTF